MWMFLSHWTSPCRCSPCRSGGFVSVRRETVAYSCEAPSCVSSSSCVGRVTQMMVWSVPHSHRVSSASGTFYMNMWNAYVAPVRVMSDLVKCVARATSDFGAFIQSPIRTRQRKMNHVETEEQFKTAIAADQITVASFSAPWCGSCKQMKPKVEALATELSQATFLKLDAEELEDLLEEIEVESFPHFRVYKSGELLAEYTGTKFEKVEEFIRANVQ